MRNLLEYLETRGGIPFDGSGPKGADYAVFCRLSYIPFDGIVPGEAGEDAVSLSGAAERVLSLTDTDKGSDRTGDRSGERSTDRRKFLLSEDESLLKAVIGSKRYSDLKIGHFVGIFSTDRQEQFCAMTFIIPGGDMVIAYRGTDGTIIGWKEDFNMGFMDELPSQKDAVAYINEAGAASTGKIYVCGHSKGGNLAMYASAFAGEAIQQRIAAVRSLDGPGFRNKVTESEGFGRILDRMESYIPQSSIVGMLLEHKERTHVIHSRAKGTGQHDIYSWEITGDDFTEEEGLTAASVRVNKAINSWAEGMPDEKRMKLTEGIFEIVGTAQAETLEELFEAKKLFTVLAGMGKLDDDTKELLGETGKIIMRSLRKRD